MIQIPLTSATDGMTGIPLPYLLHSDPMVTCIMFLCMLLVSVVFAHGKKHFLQGLKNFVRGRERGSMFDEVTASDVRHTIVLVFHTCLMLAFGVYRYLAQSAPALFEQYSHLGILAGLTAIFILFLLFKSSLLIPFDTKLVIDIFFITPLPFYYPINISFKQKARFSNVLSSLYLNYNTGK